MEAKTMSLFWVSLNAIDERELDGNHLVVTCKVSNLSKQVTSHALMDGSATDYAFIDKDFVATNNFPLYTLEYPRTIEVIDGRPISSGEVTHLPKVELSINGHTELLPAFVTTLGRYPIVLVQSWLRKHDVSIRFATNTVIFDSKYCLDHCMDRATQTKGISIETPDSNKIAVISAAAFKRTVRRKKGAGNTVFKLSIYDIDQALSQKKTDDAMKLREHVPADYHEFARCFRKYQRMSHRHTAFTPTGSR